MLKNVNDSGGGGEETQPLVKSSGPSSSILPYGPPSTGRNPQNSWMTTGILIVSAMAGTGVLSMPVAVSQSGWIGVLLLGVTAVVCMITANLLGSIMRRMPQASIRDYPSVGGAAFGRLGEVLAIVSQYTTICGIVIIFEIVAGLMINSIFCEVPTHFVTLMVGILLLVILILFPFMREVSWISYGAALCTVVATCICLALSLVYYLAPDNPCRTSDLCLTCQHSTFQTSIGQAFGVFSFAFGGHSLLPNFYAEMKFPQHFWKATAFAYPFTLLALYLPMAVIGYLAYGAGSGLAGPFIMNANAMFDPNHQTWAKIANGVIAVHVLAALPIIATPVCMKFERLFIKEKKNRKHRSLSLIVIRTVVISIATVVAILFPYFLDLVSILTAISVSLSVYVYPCLFYWKLRTSVPRDGMFKTIMVRIGLVLIILFGLAGSGASLASAVPSLIHDVQAGGNPFANLFTFGCPAGKNTTGFNNTLQCGINL